ncbi:hypothetical protein AAHC03_013771 [Spirometra sp. Aus1]
MGFVMVYFVLLSSDLSDSEREGRRPICRCKGQAAWCVGKPVWVSPSTLFPTSLLVSKVTICLLSACILPADKMRLTSVLSKRVRHNFLPVYIKKQWRESGSHMTAQRLRVPQQVLADSKTVAQLSAAEDLFSSSRYRDELARELDIGMQPQQAEQVEADRAERLAQFMAVDPDVREPTAETEPTLIFAPSRLFCRDIAQACMLANAVVRPGPPPDIQTLYNSLCSRLQGVDETETDSQTFDLVSAVEQAVLHAHLWQTDEDILPKRYNPEQLIWKFKAEFGIHPTRVVRYLLQNLFRVCELQSHRMHLTPLPPTGNALPSYWVTRDRLLETHYHWAGRRVHFCERHDLLLSSSQPTPLFDEDPTPTASDYQVADDFRRRMHLISPLIDLTSTRYYRKDSIDGWKSDARPTYPYPSLFTVNMALPNIWSDFTAPEKARITVEQRQAVAIMNCLASTIATARRLYGEDVRELPQPLAVEAICTDGVFFDFVAFQLNSLNFPDWNASSASQSEGPLNFVWIDGNRRLVDKRIPRRGLLRSTRYTDLDMSVFYRILTSYLRSSRALRAEQPDNIMMRASS